MADINEAIEAGQAALETVPPGHEHRASMLSGFAGALNSRALALHTRFGRTGSLADLDAAVEAAQAAVHATSQADPSWRA